MRADRKFFLKIRPETGWRLQKIHSEAEAGWGDALRQLPRNALLRHPLSDRDDDPPLLLLLRLLDPPLEFELAPRRWIPAGRLLPLPRLTVGAGCRAFCGRAFPACRLVRPAAGTTAGDAGTISSVGRPSIAAGGLAAMIAALTIGAGNAGFFVCFWAASAPASVWARTGAWACDWARTWACCDRARRCVSILAFSCSASLAATLSPFLRAASRA